MWSLAAPHKVQLEYRTIQRLQQSCFRLLKYGQFRATTYYVVIKLINIIYWLTLSNALWHLFVMTSLWHVIVVLLWYRFLFYLKIIYTDDLTSSQVCLFVLKRGFILQNLHLYCRWRRREMGISESCKQKNGRNRQTQLLLGKYWLDIIFVKLFLKEFCTFLKKEYTANMINTRNVQYIRALYKKVFK